MAEYSNTSLQAVQAQGQVLFSESPVPCTRGIIKHRDGSGSFLISGGNGTPVPTYQCPCCSQNASTNFLVTFGANVAIPTGGTAREISLGIMVDGSLIPSSVVRVTPTAVNAFFDVDRTINIPIWRGCCQTVSVVNLSDQSINVQEANIIFSR